MQRWAVLLSAYQYNIEYRSSAKNANADLLSRLPVGEASSGDPEEYFVFETVLMETPITATEISKHTDKDPVLAKVLEFTLSGWPNHCVDPAIQPYFTRRDELSLEDGCLLWGRRLVSDNGPQFRSEEFQNFLKSNGVDHTLTPPYHPATNGLAERNVQTFKNAFAKSSGETLGHKVANVLFTLRNTPNTTTGKTPSELFLKRSPRTRLSLVKPSLQRKVEKRQDAAKQQRDRSSSVRQFDLYQPVRVRNVRGGKDRWIPGTIVKVKGPRTYIVRIPGNNRRFVHSDHLIPDDTGANAMAGKPNINSLWMLMLCQFQLMYLRQLGN
ncbi:hypothetical protein BSL78_22560 [Apostichopus japonicus]|uniref:Integrase catalytic domain-containing protein n=1 Tax=Stichopus japonicus TaxID=307972 RepID=A0A2G8JY29_STIJA|nr:hypothetical protein BSL78_22560 [Apostichopus japonicus]